MNEEQKIKLAEALSGNTLQKTTSVKDNIADVVRILREYNDDMKNFQKYAESRNYGTPNIDRWYHTTAMYDATKGNLLRGTAALGAGILKEVGDLGKYALKGYTPRAALWEGIKDIYRDGLGVGSSLFNPDIPADENILLKNLQTPTIRAIMPEYRSKYGKKDF